MKILAIDTATEACSAALLIDATLLTRYAEPRRGHAELILPMVDELLAESGVSLKSLDCIAVGRGPGAFTGVRVAVSVAQGLAYGAERSVVPVSDLAALAQRAADAHQVSVVLACIDARMGEVYWGGFRVQADGLVSACSEEQVGVPELVELECTEDWVGAGTGGGAHPGMGSGPTERRRSPLKIDALLLPRAEEIARLAARDFREGRAVPPEQALPVYLRDRVAWVRPPK
jgi:tRNA threonylcarbamoyladenosine biosynthesis protein TsaB